MAMDKKALIALAYRKRTLAEAEDILARLVRFGLAGPRS